MSAAKPIIVGCAGLALEERERTLFAAEKPAGLILFARNCDTPAQVRALVHEFRDCVDDPDALVLIDQEGGSVARLGPPHWYRMPAAAVFGRMAAEDFVDAAAALKLACAITASELAALGITVNCAPVLDLPAAEADPVIGERAFASDPILVARLGRIVVDAMLDGGVLPVVKHIPGHGRAEVDSHEALPRVSTDLATLCDIDFVPFKALADAPMAMTAHVVYEAIDEERPATLSPVVISEAIRGDIGFSGLLVSDDIAMKALDGPMAQRALRALKAGCDLVLHCSGEFAEMQEILAAVEPMGEAKRQRISTAHSRAGSPEDLDMESAEARLRDLLGDRA